MATAKFPKGWDIYWALRTEPNTFSIDEALKAMVEASYSEFDGITRTQARNLEVRTLKFPCECLQCLGGFTEHDKPLVLAPAEAYND